MNEYIFNKSDIIYIIKCELFEYKKSIHFFES